MHEHLKNAIKQEIGRARNYVVSNLQCDLSDDDIFEQLIGDEYVLSKLRDLTGFFVPGGFEHRIGVRVGKLELRLTVALPATEKYPLKPLPQTFATLTPESPLAQALALPIRLAQEWTMLEKLAGAMLTHVHDINVLTFLMPWMKHVVADIQRNRSFDVKKREMALITREMKQFAAFALTPSRFPTMSKRMNEVALSGATLFAQRRMLQSTHSASSWARQRVVVDVASIPVPEWFGPGLDEMVTEWLEVHGNGNA